MLLLLRPPFVSVRKVLHHTMLGISVLMLRRHVNRNEQPAFHRHRAGRGSAGRRRHLTQWCATRAATAIGGPSTASTDTWLRSHWKTISALLLGTYKESPRRPASRLLETELVSRKSAQNPPPPPEPECTSFSSRQSVNPVAFARDRLAFHPDPDQARVLDPSVRRGILNCCRQWGKSTTVAVLAVWEAFYHPGSLTIVASPSARQSAEFVRKAAAFLRSLGIRPRRDGDNPISLALPNGSRIAGLPGNEDTIRCFSNVALLLIDEASRVPAELYQAVRPMVAANERAAIWLMSTPNGRQGFFYDEWTAPDSDWIRIETPATRCPRIRPAFLEEERRHMTGQQFRQEYLCEFIAADFAYFDPEAVDDAFRGTGLPACSKETTRI
jgi:hypothetical protein